MSRRSILCSIFGWCSWVAGIEIGLLSSISIDQGPRESRREQESKGVEEGEAEQDLYDLSGQLLCQSLLSFAFFSLMCCSLYFESDKMERHCILTIDPVFALPSVLLPLSSFSLDHQHNTFYEPQPQPQRIKSSTTSTIN